MDTRTDTTLEHRFDPATFERLIDGATHADSAAQAWLYLEAAHVVGQLHFKLHWQTHVHMLRLALRSRDWPEAAGQVLRLALVPLGHLSGRLPLGNPGRANVSAFQPLPVRADLADLIADAARNRT
ncbi:DUF3703 domain-containing protein [Hydrogenophaga sp. XSHU_21]